MDKHIDAERAAFEAHYNRNKLDLTMGKDAWGRDQYACSHIECLWSGWQACASQAPAPSPLNLSAKCTPMETICFRCGHRPGECDQTSAAPSPAASIKQMNAYAALVKAKDAQIAHLQAAIAKHDEAIGTLASEREANALLTAELEAASLASQSASAKDSADAARDMAIANEVMHACCAVARHRGLPKTCEEMQDIDLDHYIRKAVAHAARAAMTKEAT